MINTELPHKSYLANKIGSAHVPHAREPLSSLYSWPGRGSKHRRPPLEPWQQLVPRGAASLCGQDVPFFRVTAVGSLSAQVHASTDSLRASPCCLRAMAQEKAACRTLDPNHTTRRAPAWRARPVPLPASRLSRWCRPQPSGNEAAAPPPTFHREPCHAHIEASTNSFM